MSVNHAGEVFCTSKEAGEEEMLQVSRMGRVQGPRGSPIGTIFIIVKLSMYNERMCKLY